MPTDDQVDRRFDRLAYALCIPIFAAIIVITGKIFQAEWAQEIIRRVFP